MQNARSSRRATGGAVVWAMSLALSGCGRGSQPMAALADGDGVHLDAGATRAPSPCKPRATRTCGVELGTHEGVVDCARGNQVCVDGAWGPCALDGALAVVSVVAPPPAQVGGASLGIASVGASSTACTNDPCDPYCWVYQDAPDAAITAEGGTVSLDASSGGPIAQTNVPQGFQNQGLVDTACATPCDTTACESACQFDYHCVAGACAPFSPLGSDGCDGLDAGSNVDITTPTPCNVTSDAGAAYRRITVCNRGKAPAAPGIRCSVYPGNSPKYPNANPGPGTVVMTTATTIPPGRCESQDIPEAAFPSSGTRSLMCNVPGPGAVAECNPNNDWSVTEAVPPVPCVDMTASTFAPFVVTRVFVGACPAGSGPTWRRFGYTSTTPDGTRIELRMRSFALDATTGTCVALAAVTSSPPSPIATASTTQDPPTCSLLGDGAPCPKDLAASLGPASASLPCLQMDALGVPSATAAPTLIDWTATYDCVPNQ